MNINYIQNYYKQHLKSPVLNGNTVHPFKFYHIKLYFKTWNNALIESNIPLNRNKCIVVSSSENEFDSVTDFQGLFWRAHLRSFNFFR